jgi:hypothetical protein
VTTSNKATSVSFRFAIAPNYIAVMRCRKRLATECPRTGTNKR